MASPSVGILHRLAPAHLASTPEEVAGSLVALHSTDPASVHLAVAARTAGAGAGVAEVDRALYDDRTLVRVMAMRRTLWVVAAELVPVVAAACGRAVAADERRKLVAAVEAQGLSPDAGRFVAELEEQALAEVARRWLSSFGPVSMDPLADLKWWAGWTVAATKRALAAAGEGAPAEPSDPGPWAALVPALDPTTMGWRERSWYPGDLAPQLFDGNGNAGAAIWHSGRMVGGWAQRANGEVGHQVAGRHRRRRRRPGRGRVGPDAGMAGRRRRRGETTVPHAPPEGAGPVTVVQEPIHFHGVIPMDTAASDRLPQPRC